MENNNIEILLIGKTGHGKSSLGNFLFGQQKFEVFDKPQSGTQNTEEKTLNGLTIIDTPGLLDSQNENGDKEVDAEHYKEMISFIQKKKNLKGILIVMNSQETKITSDIKEMIKMICNTFTHETFKNVAFVFTKFQGKQKEKEKIRKNKMEFVKLTKKVVEDFYGEDNKLEDRDIENTLQSFFIDSDLEEPDEYSEQTRELILGWANELAPINVKEIPNKDPRYIRQFEKTITKTDISDQEDYVIRYTTFYVEKWATDLNKKDILLSTNYQKTVQNRIPKKKSIWKKILGGIATGIGILAAPFTGGASLTLSGVGSAMIIDSAIDDHHNKMIAGKS